MERLKANDVAKELSISVSWVYSHAHLLGTKLGGVWFFTREGVLDAISRRESLEGGSQNRYRQGDKDLAHKKAGRPMGKGPQRRISEDVIASAKRHGLIGDDFKVS